MAFSVGTPRDDIFLKEEKQEKKKNKPKKWYQNIIKTPEAFKDGYDFGDVTKTVFGTGINALAIAGKELVKKGEEFYDFSLDTSNKINTNLEKTLGLKTKEEAEKERKYVRNLVSRDLTTDAMDKIGLDDETMTRLEKNSLVTRDNIAGKVVQGVGGMIPTILVGNSVGGTLGNISRGQRLISSLPTTMTLGLGSYGGGLEEAYSEGATDKQASRYALGSTAVELATEWLTGGVPGVNDRGLLDNLEDKTLNKVSNSFAKFLIKNGYSMAGEGAEEALSEIINPYLKNATYSQGERVDWNAVVESAVVGGLTGGVLELPSNISNLRVDRANQKINQQIKKEISNQATKNIIEQNNIKPFQISNDEVKLSSSINQDSTTNIKEKYNYNIDEGIIKRSNGKLQLRPATSLKTDIQELQLLNNISSSANDNITNITENQGTSTSTDILLDSYTQHEISNYEGGKVKIAKTSEDVINFVQESKKTSNNSKLYFGKLGKKIANKINQAIGINLENYNLSLRSDNIKHILKKHSNKSEILRGQIPITEADFQLIPEIITSYDSIKQTGSTTNGKPSITFTKQIGDNYYLVNYVSDKSHNLEVQTMWKQKKKNSATVSDANIPRLTSETNSGTSSYVNDNTINAHKSQLIESSG